MAASLKGIDTALKNYLKVNRLPDIYEALLTGLAIMCPDDPYQFIIDKLHSLRDEKVMELLEWDSFIDDDMKPRARFISESNLEFIFNFDENLQLFPAMMRYLRSLGIEVDPDGEMPTPEMYEKAYEHYNNKLLSLGYKKRKLTMLSQSLSVWVACIIKHVFCKFAVCSWMQYHLRKRKSKHDMQQQLRKASLHYMHRILNLHLDVWIQWLKFRKGRQTVAYNKIHHVYHVSVCRVIFQAWHHQTKDARRTREYFERLERGENMEEDDIFGRGSGEARDDISLLPRPVAVKIFQQLDVTDIARAACVCRSWKVITQASALWARLDLGKAKNKPGHVVVKNWVTDHVATQLLSKCRPYLIHFNVRQCQMLTLQAFISIKECRNLQDLNISEVPSVNDDIIKILTEGCKILLYFNVSHNDITDASMRSIAKNLNNLQYLSISFCKKITDKGLWYLATGKGAKRLIYLDLSGCVQFTPDAYHNLALGCINIQSLILNDCVSLDDMCMKELLDQCKQIRTLSLLGSSNICDETFRKLATHKKLYKLQIESNQKITDSSFKKLGPLCVDLRHVYLTDCQLITDTSLKCLAACRNLTVLNLADCVRISDLGVRQLVESPCGAKLQELNLTNCIRVGDIAMVNIHKRCHSLAYLSVCFCDNISEAGIELLGQAQHLISLDITGCKCGDVGLSCLGNNSHMKHLSLSECSEITDLGLQKFAQQCSEIERLDLSHCQKLTDAAIKNLAFCCRMLTSLNLAGCKQLTDLSIQYVSGVCHYLESMDLTASLFITDKSLKYMRKGCKKLKKLVLLYCKAITKHAAQKMMRHVPEVMYSDADVPLYFGY